MTRREEREQAFILLFEKSFNVVSVSVRADERADMLLTGLGLSSRKIIGEQHINNSRIDYNSVNEILECRRESSMAFLKENLSNALSIKNSYYCSKM